MKPKSSQIGRTITLGFRQGWFLFLNEFQQRYRMTFFGYWWSVIKPLAACLPLIFVGKHFDFIPGEDQAPYELFALTSLILWNVFWTSATQTLYYGRRCRKVLAEYRLSDTAIISAAAIQTAMEFGLTLPFVIGLSFLLDSPLHAPGFFAFATLPLLAIAGFAVALPLVPFSLIYHDIHYGFGFLGQALLWMTPVVYAMPTSGSLYFINLFNPITYLILVPRNLILYGSFTHPNFFLLAVGMFLVLFCGSLLFFHRSIRTALDYQL
jgi:lipopolysaccharide transport system permease protein